MELRYEDSWLASRSARPLSLSLPLPLVGNEPLRGERVEHFFDNLLPDSGAIRRRLAQRYSAGSEDTFDLLAAIGRDCVGAIQLLPADETPTGFDRIEGEVLDDEAVAALLRATVSSGSFAGQCKDQDFRISIAGAQEKTALLRHDGRWLRPLGATPTTHIVKLPMGLVGNMQADMRTSVYNEWLCLRFMRELGFDVAQADIVISTALIPGRAAPVLITEEMVKSMKPGSVIVDIAAGKGPKGVGGNCPLTEADTTVQKHGVFLIGETNLPAQVPADSSSLYARNVLDFLKLIVPPAAKGEPAASLQVDLEDDIVAACLMTQGGEVRRKS